MHELSICKSIADMITRRADGRAVKAVSVRVGQLRQIVPDTLVHCWSLMCEDTPLAGCAMLVESVPGRISCSACGHAQTLSAPVLCCESCGGHDVRVVAGEEFLVTSMEVAEA